MTYADQWTRKKPRRIIQDQLVIQLLIAYACPCAVTLAVAVFWMTSIYPPTISLILILWSIAVISYLALRIIRKKMR